MQDLGMYPGDVVSLREYLTVSFKDQDWYRRQHVAVASSPSITLLSHIAFLYATKLAPFSPLTTHLSPLTTHHSPLTTHHSPLTTHHSPLTSHLSPLTSHHWRDSWHHGVHCRWSSRHCSCTCYAAHGGLYHYGCRRWYAFIPQTCCIACLQGY
jgi:hypothetical protein